MHIIQSIHDGVPYQPVITNSEKEAVREIERKMILLNVFRKRLPKESIEQYFEAYKKDVDSFDPEFDHEHHSVHWWKELPV